MLGKALQAKDPGPAQRPKGSASSQRIRALDSALKPRPAAELNASRSLWPAKSNSLKRTVSQASAKEPSSRQSSMMSSNTLAGLSQGSNDGGRVGKLHDTVYFDENDFEDDDNIDLDADEPAVLKPPQISYPTLPQPSHATQPNPSPGFYTTLPMPTQRTDYTIEPPSSNEKVPWSSSPLQHKLSPPTRTIPPAKPGKRRTIPWKTEQHRGSFTPFSKDTNRSPYGWNMTASAMKGEQKRLRQGNKKLVKDLEADDASQKIASTKKKNVARVSLSQEQRKVLDLVAEENKSVFFTGSAGTGKSVLLREIIKTLRAKNKSQPDRVAVTASTGLAACNVGGVTLHSFAGIGLGKEDIPELVRKVKRNQKAKMRWIRTKILVIDEISMVDGDLFDKLEGVARNIRNNGRPFGGIQLVITGDFFQLPPVPDYGKVAKFSFDAATWNTSIDHTIGLTQVFRQKDPGASLLNSVKFSANLRSFCKHAQ